MFIVIKEEGKLLTMKKQEKNKGITLIVLIITIIILLILAGVTIASLGGKNGLISRANQAKKAQIKAEMKEQLVLKISELQLEKNGGATLDDITQEWANTVLEEYKPTISEDASITGKEITMSKNGIFGKYIIDEKLNVTEIEEVTGSQLTYEVKSRDGENLQILITITNNEDGLKTIIYNDGYVQNANGEKVVSRNCTIQLGVEYKVKIISNSEEEKTETILVNDYYQTITKDLGEGASIDNAAIKTAYNKPYKATITTSDDYILESLTVKMGEQEVTVDKTTGIINIEKVTGDIEIIAKTRRIEIVTTEAYVNTTPNAINSADANSVDKMKYKLYVTFSATLEGENCIIKPDLSETIVKNGTYTYTITGTYKGKKITTTKDVVVNQYKTTTNLVKYDAGDWTIEEIQQLKNNKLYDINTNKSSNAIFKLNNETGLNFTFGGFTYKGNTADADKINSETIITSRNQSVSPQAGGYGTPTYDGWKIFESYEKDGKTYIRKLIHAGSPENFVYCITEGYDACRAVYLLSNGERQKDFTTLQDQTLINKRNWDMYKDKNQLDLINNVHCATYEELSKSDNIAIGCYYWVADNYGGYLRCAYDGGILYEDARNSYCFGVRPVIEMNDGVYVKSGDGTEMNPYVLAKD